MLRSLKRDALNVLEQVEIPGELHAVLRCAVLRCALPDVLSTYFKVDHFLLPMASSTDLCHVDLSLTVSLIGLRLHQQQRRPWIWP